MRLGEQPGDAAGADHRQVARAAAREPRRRQRRGRRGAPRRDLVAVDPGERNAGARVIEDVRRVQPRQPARGVAGRDVDDLDAVAAAFLPGRHDERGHRLGAAARRARAPGAARSSQPRANIARNASTSGANGRRSRVSSRAVEPHRGAVAAVQNPSRRRQPDGPVARRRRLEEARVAFVDDHRAGVAGGRTGCRRARSRSGRRRRRARHSRRWR